MLFLVIGREGEVIIKLDSVLSLCHVLVLSYFSNFLLPQLSFFLNVVDLLFSVHFHLLNIFS